MSLLTLCQAAARQLNLPVPASIVGNTDDETAVLLLRLASEEGESLMRRYPWQILISEKTFTTLAQETQTGALPTDYDRMLPETMFNRTTRRFITGPLSAEDWQQQKALVQVYVNPVYRIRGDALLLANAPAAGETIAFEYVSKNWCKAADSTPQSDWVLDTDLGRLDEKLMTLGLVWRFRQVKGLSYGEDLALYERRVTDAMMRDGTKPRISTDHYTADRVPRAPQMPETLIYPP